MGGESQDVWQARADGPGSAWLRRIAGAVLVLAGAGGLWFAQQIRDVEPVTVVLDPRAVLEPPVLERSEDPDLDEAAVAKTQRTIDWSTLCRPAPIQAGEPAVVHRWRDNAGVLHYSSAAPPGDASDAARIEASVPAGANITVQGLDTELPALALGELQSDAAAVIALLRSELGIVLDRTIRIDAVVVADRATFDRLRGEAAPRLAAIGGFYNPADRRLVVRRQARDAGTRMVLRHEAVHAILHESVGPLPIWLNEGLAEYFEHLGSDAHSVTPAPEWLGVLRAFDLAERIDLLDNALRADHERFHGADVEAMYASSWAITSYLMGDSQRRRLLRDLIAFQRNSEGCRAADLRLEIDRRFSERLDGFLAAVSRSVESR